MTGEFIIDLQSRSMPIDLGDVNVELAALRKRLEAVKNKLWSARIFEASLSCESAANRIVEAQSEVIEILRAESNSAQLTRKGS